MEFSERLRNLRNERKLNQKDLADYLNYGYTAISNYEAGRNEPSIKDLIKIASFFHVSLDYLLCVTDIKNYHAENDDPQGFEEFRKLYANLSEETRDDLHIYMKYLIYKQDEKDKPKGSQLKVAQTQRKYQTRNKK